MKGYILGQRCFYVRLKALISTANLQLLHTVIDTAQASKEALVHYLESNPSVTDQDIQNFLAKECDSISIVNDHLAIGLPMNSFRFTLNTLLHHYFADIVPNATTHQLRVNALSRFVSENPEITLVFPQMLGRNLYVGDFTFSVNNITVAPTFVQFDKRDLTYVNVFYFADSSRVKELSEYIP